MALIIMTTRVYKFLVSHKEATLERNMDHNDDVQNWSPLLYQGSHIEDCRHGKLHNNHFESPPFPIRIRSFHSIGPPPLFTPFICPKIDVLLPTMTNFSLSLLSLNRKLPSKWFSRSQGNGETVGRSLNCHTRVKGVIPPEPVGSDKREP